MKKLVVVGGGTGGHVTPIHPVLSEVRKLQPDCSIVAIGKANDAASQLLSGFSEIDKLHFIQAGKWRRYQDESWLQRLFDVKTHFLNLRDVVLLAIGFLQSFAFLLRERPDAIFIKGGFVGVPVGLAATVLRYPFITHDSDALAGVANRIIGRWAKKNAVAAEPSNYPYEPNKVVQTGVPISTVFQPTTNEQKNRARQELSINSEKPLLLVVGGSLGAERVNDAMISNSIELANHCAVVHVAGENNRVAVQRAIGDLKGYTVLGYTNQLHVYLAAADLVLTRAGATTTAEIAAMAKPAIFIPAPQLADQNKNAVVLKAAGLATLSEPNITANPSLLAETILRIIQEPDTLKLLSSKAKKYAQPDAASKLAQEIISISKHEHNKA